MSLIQMHRSPNRFAAWLAVCAILLLFIAPVISKSLVNEAGRHSMMMPGMMMADDDEMSMTAPPAMTHHHEINLPAEGDMAASGDTGTSSDSALSHQEMSPGAMAAMSPLEHARIMQHHPMSMMDDSACGYCVLLAHLPLDLTNLPALWSALQAAKQPDLPLFRPVVARFIPRFFHPRAPPVY